MQTFNSPPGTENGRLNIRESQAKHNLNDMQSNENVFSLWIRAWSQTAATAERVNKQQGIKTVKLPSTHTYVSTLPIPLPTPTSSDQEDPSTVVYSSLQTVKLTQIKSGQTGSWKTCAKLCKESFSKEWHPSQKTIESWLYWIGCPEAITPQTRTLQPDLDYGRQRSASASRVWLLTWPCMAYQHQDGWS